MAAHFLRRFRRSSTLKVNFSMLTKRWSPILLDRPKTIVFGRTSVLLLMFFFHSRDLRDAWADRREILHDGQ